MNMIYDTNTQPFQTRNLYFSCLNKVKKKLLANGGINIGTTIKDLADQIKSFIEYDRIFFTIKVNQS